MNWREFTDLTAAMAEGRTEPNTVAVNAVLDRPATLHSTHCWQQFSRVCASAAVGEPVYRSRPPSPWLPPLP